MTLTVAANDLRRVLQAAYPATAHDDYHPALSCIHLEARGGVLAATGTDRYVAVRARCAAEGALPPVLMPRGMARVAIWALDRRRTGPTSRITIDVDARLLTVGTEPRLSAETDDPDGYPKLAKLFARAADEDQDRGSRHVQMRLDSLATLAKVFVDLPPSVDGLKWSIGPQAGPGEHPSPILVEYDGWLSALLMPQRLPADEDPRKHIPYDLPDEV